MLHLFIPSRTHIPVIAIDFLKSEKCGHDFKNISNLKGVA